ncbi:peroxidase family protein [Methylobacterium nigriterrae]|uniref:peroxidase family protein n=1 Tax=Methylobacterium nigriterrae TaxID=3127512 RepID=UPI0030139FB6
MPDTSAGPSRRDTSRDGFRNRIETFVLGNFRPIWNWINDHPSVARTINRLIVNNAVLKAPTRPLALSTMASFTSWPSLTDRTWFSRYLPPEDRLRSPSIDDVLTLFASRSEGPRVSSHSTLLFPAFAQWFTDGFLMTNEDRRRTRTNHQIDLSQVYGLTPCATDALRLAENSPGLKGRLRSVVEQDEEWAPNLFDADGRKRPEFAALPDPVRLPEDWPFAKKASLFAFGGERANATLYTAAINTLFLREHNRLCAALEADHPDWDDERVFQTARNINIVQLIKIVIEDYINHISPYWFKLLADASPCYKAVWNRENWIPVEFNVLYRWHSLVPDVTIWDGARVPMAEARFDHGRLRARGLAAAFDSASRSPAWSLGLFNTSADLIPVERATLLQGRSNKLSAYNAYRALMRYPKLTSFEQISSDPAVVDNLRRVYGDVDQLEFYVGLLAEDHPPNSAVPPLLGRMVAADAFSHALTNPLLAPHVFHAGTFSEAGMRSIAATSRLHDLVERNVPRLSAEQKVSMSRGDLATLH